jgi:putative membrane protein
MELKAGTAKPNSLPEQWATGLALVALGSWPVWRLLDGSLANYLHPRFNLLAGFTGLVLIQLGGWLLWRKSRREPSGNLSRSMAGIALVALVAMAGLLLKPAAVENVTGEMPLNNGSNRALAAALQQRDWNAATDTSVWNLLDWSAALNNSDRVEQLVGKPVNLVGFVTNNKARSFEVARMVVVCCVADSAALSLPVAADNLPTLEEGQWVQVRGVLAKAGNGVPVVNASNVELIQRPAQPYLYP